MSNAPHFLIVQGDFYEDISAHLLSGATAALGAIGATHEVISVPGALEIPGAIKMAAGRGTFDAYVALGCVIRGETSHYDVVAIESARALMDMTVNYELPIGNGILTCDTRAQAIVRADPDQKNKGRSAVEAAQALLNIKTGKNDG